MEWWGNSGMFATGPTLWTPAQISPSLWYDASDNATVFATDTGSTLAVTGGTVGRLADKSGNNRDITQATAGRRPVYTAAGLNGRNVITFDGTDDILFSTSVGASGFVSISILGVFRLVSTSATEDIPMGTGLTGTSGTTRTLYRNSPSATMWWSHYNADYTSSTLTWDVGNYHIFGGWNTALSGVNARLMRDGTVTTGSIMGQNSVNTADGFSVGSFQGNVPIFAANMAVGEVLVFYRAISDEDRQLCEGYFAYRWGLQGNLPAAHPYKTSPPTV